MSAEEVDWFEKDDDDFVLQVQKKNAAIIMEAPNELSEEHPKTINKEAFEIGIYDLPRIERLSAFSKDHFEIVKTLKNTTFPQTILWDVLNLVVEIFKHPVCERLEDFMIILVECDFFEKIETALWLANHGCYTTNDNKFTDIIELVLVICQHYIQVNIASSNLERFLPSMERILRSKEYCESYKFLQTIANLLTILQKKRNEVKNLEISKIYPTVEELHKREIEKPEIYGNVLFPSVRTYIDIQMALARREIIDGLHRQIYILKSPHRIPIYKKAQFRITKYLNYSTDINTLIFVHNEENEGKENQEENCEATGQYNLKYDLSPGTILLFTTSLKIENLIITEIIAKRDENHIFVKIRKIYGEPMVFHDNFIMFEGKSFLIQIFLDHIGLKLWDRLDENNFPIKDFVLSNSNLKSDVTDLNGKRNFAYSYEQLSSNLCQNQSNETQISLVLESLMPDENYDELKMIDTLINTMDKQVLVICYSNDVLDEFLLKIVKNCTRNIVRLGGRSKCKELDQYHIRNCDEIIQNRRSYKFTRQDLNKLTKIASKCISEEHNRNIYNQTKLIELLEELEDAKQIKSCNSLRNKKVIGMTSSYALLWNSFVKQLNAPIVIIKDACHIPEFHTITYLTKTTEQLILFEGKRHFKCKSLFDSLLPGIDKKFCLSKICEIHAKTRCEPHIYLCSSNLEYVANIRGMDKDIFFFNYDTEIPEIELNSADSYNINYKFEVTLLFYLAKYLLKQGYQPYNMAFKAATKEQIEIINQVRDDVYPELEGIETVGIVDTIYKNKIILLPISLNNFEEIGKMICFILSSAKSGFYFVGKIDILAKKFPEWKDIKEILEAQDALGTYFPMTCENHENS